MLCLTALITGLTSCSSDSDNEKMNNVEVTVSAPSQVKSNVSFCLEAQTNKSVDRVSFYIDGVEYGTVISSPYQWEMTTTSLSPVIYNK